MVEDRGGSSGQQARAYTVQEIDALRLAVEVRFRKRLSGLWTQQEIEKQTEDRVRTHMLAGHTAEDLLASESPA